MKIFNENLKDNHYQFSELKELESSTIDHLNSVQISNESNKNEGLFNYIKLKVFLCITLVLTALVLQKRKSK